MMRLTYRPAVLAAFILPFFAPAGLAAASADICTLAIMHANVVPMDRERVLLDRTVLVARDKILSIRPAEPKAAKYCARVIDAQGRYLAPGLNDMHVHIETVAFGQAFGIKVAPIDYPAALALYMANGVTGIRVMSGALDILAFRDSQRGQASPYPRMVVATPMLSGSPPVIPEPLTKVLRSPEEARQVVRQYKQDGYDFVKVRDNLPESIFRAAIAQAKQEGLYVDGHISMGQGLSAFDVLRSGQHAIAHLDNLQMLMKDPARDTAAYIRLLHDCSCFVESTLQVETNALAQMTNPTSLTKRPELTYVHPMVLNVFWPKYSQEKGDPKFFQSLFDGEKALVKKFIAAGVHIVAGTDALSPTIVPGTSLHDELSTMVEAGLTPYQALQTATASPAAYVPGFSDVGILATGRTANAVLVEENPLKDVRALQAPDAVMINGNWMSHEDLQRRLDAAAALYAKP